VTQILTFSWFLRCANTV